MECIEEQSIEESAPSGEKEFLPECKQYEEAIIKLEADVWMHIRVEQQMRLHIENLQQQIEDSEWQKKAHDERDVTIEKLNAELRDTRASNDEVVQELKRRLLELEEKSSDEAMTLREDNQKLKNKVKKLQAKSVLTEKSSNWITTKTIDFYETTGETKNSHLNMQYSSSKEFDTWEMSENK